MEYRRLRRLKGFDYAGPHRYSLTIATKHGAPIFRRLDLAECICSQFLRAARDCEYAVIVYCAMPDHFHALVDGATATVPLPLFMKKAKQMSGYHGKRIAKTKIWQDGYYEHVLKPTDDVREVARYIAENPIQQNLVTSIRDYPVLGSGVYSREELFSYLQLDDHESPGTGTIHLP